MSRRNLFPSEQDAFPNPEAIPGSLELKRIAAELREDFEKGKIAADYVLELLREDESRIFSLPDLDAIKRGLEDFPKGQCIPATQALKARFDAGKKINGSFDTEERIPEWKYYTSVAGEPTTIYEPHSFLGFRAWVPWPPSSPYEDKIKVVKIVDITADQFGEQHPKVYVGPLNRPWMEDGLSIEDIV